MTTEVNVLTISRYFYWRQKLMTSPIISRYSLQTALIRKGIGIVQPRSPILSNTMNRRTTTDIVKYKARTRTGIPAHDRAINAQTQQAGKANNKIPEPSGLQIIKKKQQENVDAQHLQTIKPDTIQGSIRKLLNPPDKIIQHFQQESDCSRHNKLNGRQCIRTAAYKVTVTKGMTTKLVSRK